MALTILIVAVCAGVCMPLASRVAPTNLAMVFLLGVALVASLFGAVEATIASLLSVIVFDLMFVPPRWTLAVSDTQYLITFGVMLAVSLLISRLTLRLRAQARTAAERERHTAALYALSRELARGRSKTDLAKAAVQEVEGAFGVEAAVLTVRDGELVPLVPSTTGFETREIDDATTAWSQNRTIGGCLPLRGAQGAVGVLAISPHHLDTAQQGLLETFANSLGIAIERAQLAKESHEARFQAESERMRNALLSSISHDLRTPLTAIAGAASALAEQGAGELAETIYHESLRLNHQVQNLLDMTRLQSGGVEPRFEWSSLEEIIGSSLARTRELLGSRHTAVRLPPEMPLMRIDAGLVEKLFANLLENAVRYTWEDATIEIEARVQSEVIRVIVADNGPGIPKGQETAIFERWARRTQQGQGLGLGLAICRAIMRLHDGRIWAQNRPGGGAEFHLEFPRPTVQPEAPVG